MPPKRKADGAEDTGPKRNPKRTKATVKNDHFYIRELLNRRTTERGVVEYQVKWEGTLREPTTWMTRERLSPTMVQRFDEALAQAEAQAPASAPAQAQAAAPGGVAAADPRNAGLARMQGRRVTAEGAVEYLVSVFDRNGQEQPARWLPEHEVEIVPHEDRERVLAHAARLGDPTVNNGRDDTPHITPVRGPTPNYQTAGGFGEHHMRRENGRGHEQPTQWGPMQWGPTQWGPTQWGPTQWGPTQWGPAQSMAPTPVERVEQANGQTAAPSGVTGQSRPSMTYVEGILGRRITAEGGLEYHLRLQDGYGYGDLTRWVPVHQIVGDIVRQWELAQCRAVAPSGFDRNDGYGMTGIQGILGRRITAQGVLEYHVRLVDGFGYRDLTKWVTFDDVGEDVVRDFEQAQARAAASRKFPGNDGAHIPGEQGLADVPAARGLEVSDGHSGLWPAGNGRANEHVDEGALIDLTEGEPAAVTGAGIGPVVYESNDCLRGYDGHDKGKGRATDSDAGAAPAGTAFQAPFPPNIPPQALILEPDVPTTIAPQSIAPQSTAPQSTAPQSTAPQTTPPQTTATQTTAPRTRRALTRGTRTRRPRTASRHTAAPQIVAPQIVVDQHDSNDSHDMWGLIVHDVDGRAFVSRDLEGAGVTLPLGAATAVPLTVSDLARDANMFSESADAPLSPTFQFEGNDVDEHRWA